MWLNKTYDKLLRNLKIKRADQNKLLWSALMAFIAGALQCYISSFPMALFLTHFGSASLPKIYLAVALLSVLFGLKYTFFEYRVSFNRLKIGLTMTVGILWTLLGIVLISSNSYITVVVLLIWAIMSYDLIGLAVWSVLNHIFNLQQAKQSFGVIKSCHSIGGLLAGLLSPLLLTLVDIKHLIIFLGLFTFVLVLVIAALLRHARSTGHFSSTNTKREDDSPDAINMRALLRNKYVLKIFALTLLGVFSIYIIALLFNTAASVKYPSAASLASFLGVFFGLVDGADLLCSAFLYNWLLKRFGLIATLFVLPVIGIAVTIPIAIFSTIPTLFHFLFWFIVILKLSEDSIRASMTNMSHLLLLHPFPPKIRVFLLSKSEVIVAGLATGLISILLIISTHLLGVSLLFLAVSALTCFIVTVLILSTLKSDYINALIKAIAHRYSEEIELPYPTKENLRLLKNCLTSAHSDEVIYALMAIERIDSSELPKVLDIAIKSRDLAVSEYALDKIKQYNLVSYFSDIIAILKQENQNTLRAKALITASHLNYAKSKKWVHLLLDDDFLPVSSAALITLFKYNKDAAIKTLATEKLHHLIRSTHLEERLEGAYIIGEINAQEVNKLLSQLTLDPSDAVRRSAFKAVMKTHYQELYSELLNNLPLLSIGTMDSNDFFKGNRVILSIIRQNFASYPHDIQVKSLYIASQINDKKAQEFIEDVILNGEDSLKEASLDALNHFDRSLKPSFLKKLFHEIIREAKYLNEQYQYLTATPNLELTTLLRDALKRKVQLSTKRLLLALSLYYDKSLIIKAFNGLEKASEDARSYGLELIDTTLEIRHKKTVLPILAKVYLSDSVPSTKLHSKTFYKVLQNNIKPIDLQNISLLMSMACVYVIIKGGLKVCNAEIEELKESNIQMITEAIEWANG